MSRAFLKRKAPAGKVNHRLTLNQEIPSLMETGIIKRFQPLVRLKDTGKMDNDLKHTTKTTQETLKVKKWDIFNGQFSCPQRKKCSIW